MSGMAPDEVEELCLQAFLLAVGDAYIFGVALRAAAGGMEVNGSVG